MIDYYQKNAREYFSRTASVDPADFLSKFVCCLPPGASILDVGCGSGRDLHWLKGKGFHPTGFERAPNLSTLAEEVSGCPVIRGDFSTYDFSSLTVDGILLSGSFVHLDRNQLAPVFKNVIKALVPGGHVYLSLKQGKGEYKGPDGRRFTLWQNNELEAVFKKLGLSVCTFSTNISALKTGEVWLAYILMAAVESSEN